MQPDKIYSFEELLDEQGSLVWRTTGRSMRPLIRQGKDVIVITKPQLRPEKYDVILYKVKDKYLLHRVLEVHDGYYTVAGDNNTFLEKVEERQILGVMTEFLRGGKQYDLNSRKYRFYTKNYCGKFKLKCAVLKPYRALRSGLSRAYHKIFKKG